MASARSNHADAYCYKTFRYKQNIASGFVSRSVDPFLKPFAFQLLEKAFRNRVVMAVSATTHAAFQTVLFQERLPLMARVLTALDALLRVKSLFGYC
ncbi:hypothetical protein BN1200_1100077 [Klebsiella variicola]|nr:hypothetical protein BN1200_1100077 [Klebsiella variicola]